MLKLGFIGAGTVGTALAVRLSQKGYLVAGVHSRSLSSAERLAEAVGTGVKVFDSAQAVADSSDMVFITTPDGAISSVVSEVHWHQGQNVVHCSGADSTGVLEPATKAGAQVAAFHPLQTFASLKQAIDNIPGSTFAIEAEEPLLGTLKKMAGDLYCNWIKLEADDKAVYHASAVMACNHLVALVNAAAELWSSFGVPKEQATKALLPLIKGTINNIETLGIPQCLTGPIARGDIGTVYKHLKTLSETNPEIVPTYCELGLKTIPVALAKGKLGIEVAHEIEAALKQQKSIVEGSVEYAHHAEK